MSVEPADKPSRDKFDRTVRVSNLPSIYDESDLRSLFANVGTVLSCTLEAEPKSSHIDSEVEFSTPEEAAIALKLSGVSVRYHILKIEKHEPPDQSRKSGSEGSNLDLDCNKIAKVLEARDAIANKLSLKASKESCNGGSDGPKEEKQTSAEPPCGLDSNKHRTDGDDGRGSPGKSADRYNRRYSRGRSRSSGSSSYHSRRRRSRDRHRGHSRHRGHRPRNRRSHSRGRHGRRSTSTSQSRNRGRSRTRSPSRDRFGRTKPKRTSRRERSRSDHLDSKRDGSRDRGRDGRRRSHSRDGRR